jgi:two-component system phosphate regulon response regulator PhoB
MTNILVVENDHDTRELLEYILLREGYRIRSETDGDATLAAVEASFPDLVLLDWMIPSRSGIDVCRAIRAKPQIADIPIVLVSAKTRVDDIRTGLAAGANDYVTKPFGVSEILACVRSALTPADSSAR